MNVEYEYKWRKDCESLFDDMIEVAEVESEFTGFLKYRKESSKKGDLKVVIALGDGKPIGFLVYGFTGDIANLKLIHVLDIPQKQEIAVNLLKRGIKVLEKMREEGDISGISGELYYLAGSTDPLVELMLDSGAYIYVRVGMSRDMDVAPPEPLLPEGYSVHEWSSEEIPLMGEFLYEAFKDSIDLVFWEHLRQPDTAIAYIERIFEGPEWTFVPFTNLYLRYNGKICAASFCANPEKNKGGVLMGVLKEHRGKGLGRFLLTQVLTTYYEVQLEKVGLEVTLQNEIAYPFFRRYGFEEIYRLIGYTF